MGTSPRGAESPETALVLFQSEVEEPHHEGLRVEDDSAPFPFRRDIVASPLHLAEDLQRVSAFAVAADLQSPVEFAE